jgi:pilus assembly protein Flp/PilA
MMRLLSDESGQGMVEYGLIIALVATVVIIGLSAVGNKAVGLFSGVGDTLTAGQ